MNRLGILVVGLAILLGAIGWRAVSLLRMQNAPDQVVGFLVDEQEDSPDGRAPWDTFAVEQGVPHQWIAQRDLSLFTAPELRAHFVAIAVPDRLNRLVSEDAANILSSYVRAGGVVVVVGDAGTLLPNGRFADRSQLADLTGVEYLRFRLLAKKSYGHGVIRFTSPQAVYRWHVPPGKLEHGDSISSYAYGALSYPLPSARADPGTQVDAVSALGPAFTQRRLGAGTVFYIAPQLGYLRSIGDTFPMQIAVRRTLLDMAGTPHLVATPDARGEMIVNWHIDSNVEWKGIPNFAAQGLLRPAVRYDFDITAGPDFAKPGDGLGFDACGKGRPYVHELEPYGSIGSHGGWLHNGFAHSVEEGTMSEQQMREMIGRNDACLSSITHQPIVDYAAPDGAHPWQMTIAIGSLGIRSYYYTGDTGTSPELAFFGGRLITDRVWAFPIMPNGATASFAEMSRAKLPPSNIQHWLISTLDQAERDRSIYLVYSHVYDLQRNPQYVAPLGAFLDRVASDQRRGLTDATTMGEASAFLERFVLTRADFVRLPGGVLVRLANPQGLRDVAFALPRSWIAPDDLPGGVVAAGADGTFSYFAVRDNATQLDLRFKNAGGKA